MKKTFSIKNILLVISLSLLTIVSAIGIGLKTNPSKVDAYRMPGNSEVARQIGQEGIVLLKNTNNCLPFTSNMAVGGLGVGQDNNFQYGGGGSGWVHAGDENRINPATALENAASGGKIKSYTRMGSASGSFDRVIYFITRYSTEGRDIYQRDYYLNDVEKNDITNLCNLVGKDKVVVLLNVPSVVDTTWLLQKDVGAIAVVWMGGEQAGNSLADVLTGTVTPSGKLADSWAKDLQYYSTTKNSYWDSITNLSTLQKTKNDFGEFGSVKYEEDLYLGYRYFETFDPNYEKVNFEFGYGLSYTKFNIDVTGVNINKNQGKIKVFVKVTNTGSYSGKEVVQVYYSTPNDVIDSPAKQLIAFKKTETLAPNASQVLTLEFDIKEMSQFDDMGKICLDAYVLQRGNYNIYVGNSSKDSGKRLVATYTQNANEVVEQCSHLTTNLDKRLTSNGTYELINSEYYEIGHGLTFLQAEDYQSSSQYTESTNDWNVDEIVGRHEIGFSSGLHLRQAQQKTFRYRVYVEQTGTYNIDFIMANARGNTINNCLSLFVDYTDDATDNGTNQNVTVNCIDTGDWFTNWTRIAGNKVTFNKTGACYLTIVTGSDCANIDYYAIYNNSISATEVSQISATAYTSAVNNENTDQAPTPEASIYGTCLGYLHSGRQVVYTLNVETAGDYYLDFDASSCAIASDAVATVSINGSAQSTKVAIMRTACAPADGAPMDHFFYFTKTNQLRVTLPKGTVTLTIDFHNSAITNLRTINFTPVALGARSYTFTDNTSYWNITDTFKNDGVGLDKGFKYIDVVQGNCTAEEFLNQMHSSELAYMTGLYTGTDVTGDGVNEPRLEDVNSGVGGFGGVLGTALVDYYSIPYAATADGPAGVRFINENNTSISEFYRRSTYFPCITMLASSWNVDLAYEFGRAYGAEAQAVGVEVMLAPGMNIHRNPLGGRNFEYISEDPFVTGSFATAITLGCQSRGVSVSVKHFAANSQENNRFQQDTKVSARAIREIYLKAFEMVIKNANPGTMMSSYNYVNGVSTAEHKELLTNVVRGEWKWDGVLESDWSENINDCTMVNAGNNLHSCVIHYDQIEFGYKLRLIDKAKLVENASYVIKFLIRSQASSLSESTIPNIEAASKITCTDGSGTVWEPMEHTNIQIISPNKSVWEAGLASGVHGDARIETQDGTAHISWTSANSGVYGGIAVEKAGNYYLSYTLNVGAIAGKYGNFNLYIDGKLADTFTNPSKKISVQEEGKEDWVAEDIFYGDAGSEKYVYLTAGMHRIYIKINDEKFNIHNVIFSYEKQHNQVIDEKNSTIEVRNYTAKTNEVRVEGNHIASLHNGTVTYKITVQKAGTYGLNYLLNIPGVNNSYGNFTLSIDGNVVDAFTNPNKVTTGTDWVTFKWFNGDNGEKQVYLTEGEHTILFSSSVQEYNVQSIRFRFVSPENHSKIASSATKIGGASIWADKDGKTGKIRFMLSYAGETGVNISAYLVETSKFNDNFNATNYAKYNATKITCTKSGNTFIAESNVASGKYATSYTVVFIADKTADSLTVYNRVVSDSRSCKQVAQSLISAGKYTNGVLGYYLV